MHAIYDDIGRLYARYRRPDPRIVAAIMNAIGDARPLLDVGAGTGSYEPADRLVVAVEPSAMMIAQRAPGLAPVVRGVAEHLPFADGAFDAAMAVLTVHWWPDIGGGLREMRRVTRGPIAVLTFDTSIHDTFWFVREYVAASGSSDLARRAYAVVIGVLGDADVRVVPVPQDCADGFFWAYWRRPEMYLDAGARACISSLAQLSGEDIEPGLGRLAADLQSGAWRRRHADLLEMDAIDGGYRLVVGR